MKLTSLSLTQSTHSWLSTFSWRYCDCLYLILLGDIQFPNMDGLKNIILLQFHSGSQPPPPPTHLVFVAADRKRCIFFSFRYPPTTHSRLPRNPPKILPGESLFYHFSAIVDLQYRIKGYLGIHLCESRSPQPCQINREIVGWAQINALGGQLPPAIVFFRYNLPTLTPDSPFPQRFPIKIFVQNGNGALTD